MKKQILVLVFVAFGAALANCENDKGKETCDGLCDDSEICLDDYCATKCATNDDCFADRHGAGWICRVVDGKGGGCVPQTDGGDTGIPGNVETNTCVPSAEVCDGADNDCDGAIDEGVKNACGQCGAVPTEVCDGVDNDCDGGTDEGVKNVCGECGAVPAEVCDGKDNNCDGVIDEGCECYPVGEKEPCGSDVGVCKPGEHTCNIWFKWGDCFGAVFPGIEVCDGLDNNCNGSVDDDYDFSSDIENCGYCGNVCDAASSFNSCVNGVCEHTCLPSFYDLDGFSENGCEYQCVPTNGGSEKCDYIDNDCDGATDEDYNLLNDENNCGICGYVCLYDNASSTCFAGICLLTDCDQGYVDLNNNPDDGCEYACDFIGEELCDGLDNDCDGSIDELVFCNCVDGDTMPCGDDVGDCKDGLETCQSGSWSECEDAVFPQPEVCDNHDNDCDGETDEGFNLLIDKDNCSFCGHVCLADYANAICLDGECAIQFCQFGTYDLDGDYGDGCEYACFITHGGVEQCDSIDNDCDGLTDEDTNFDADEMNCGVCGNICSFSNAGEICDHGECQMTVCSQNFYDLNKNPLDGCEYNCISTGAEVGDDVDNNCDGQIDEGMACSEGTLESCGSDVGECQQGFRLCADNKWSECLLEVIPEPDICDELDNDCDGATDEDFDFMNDANNCGVCGHVCDLSGAVSDCFATVCQIKNCFFGFYDLNGDAFDGCEYACFATKGGVEACDGIDNDCDGATDEGFDFASDPKNCGGCGNVCGFAFATADCLNSVCVMTDCLIDHYDLNGQEADGCEYACQLTNGGIEIGDNQDNNCDGNADEGTACLEGNFKLCGSNVGECKLGSQKCEAGVWSDCLDAVSPEPDVCDGLDNDCDSAIDEDFNLATDVNNCGVCGNKCSLANAASNCVGGVCEIAVCDAGFHDLDDQSDNGCEYACFATKGGVEACDSIDNNCDGIVDEGFDFSVDESNCGACGQICAFAHAGSNCVDSVCLMTVCQDNYYDLNGQSGDGCEYLCTATGPELCGDLLDNDCNGTVNDGCACFSGTTQVCGSNVGSCKYGVETCGGAEWGDCAGGVASSPDICDGLDNDCDGAADEDFDLATDLLNCGACGNVCDVAAAVNSCVQGQCAIKGCLPGFYNLDNQYANGCEYACFATNGGAEACDGIDNNCDGVIDEEFDFSADEANCGACGKVCAFAHAGSNCVNGACLMTVCQDNYYDLNGQSGDGCEYFCVKTNNGVEIGDNLDNNCDGDVDEGTVCFEGNSQPCGSNVGQCKIGFQACLGKVWSICFGDVGPQPDVCDGLDNDCDGATDEDFNLQTDTQNCGACGTVCTVPNAGMNCVQGKCVIAACETSFWNLNGQSADGCEYQCLATLNGTEACDGIDNDCDGLTDEATNLQTDSKNCGVCGNDCSLLPQTTGVACSAGQCQIVSCLPTYYDLNKNAADGCEYNCSPTNAGEEVCDGVDNDCDGQKDEGCPLTVVSCNICCGFGLGQPVVWWGNDPPFMWTGGGESCGTVTMTVNQVCLRGKYPSTADTGWVDYNCNKGGAWTGWKATDVLSCVDQNGSPVTYSVVTGAVDPGGEAEILVPGICP